MTFIGKDKERPWNHSGTNEEWWQFGEDVKKNSVDGWMYVTEDPCPGDILITDRHVMIAMASPDNEKHLLIANSSGGHSSEGNPDDRRLGMGKGKIQ